MNTNEFTQEKKDGLFSRIFSFFKHLFKTTPALPEPQVLNEDVTGNGAIENIENTDNSTKSDFINELKVELKEENPELLELQEKFESNQIKLTELSDEDLTNLNNLYQQQIDDLKLQLNSITSLT